MFDTDLIPEASERTWELMHKYARTHASIRNTKHGMGYIIPGAIAQYIVAAVEGGMGVDVSRNDISLIRQYLKSTGNVIALSPITEDRKRWRIFVAEEYTEREGAVAVAVSSEKPKSDIHARIAEREQKLTPEEAGEDREPFPVEVTKMSGQPLSESQVALLRTLSAHGGKVTHDKGRAAIELAEKAGVADQSKYAQSAYSGLEKRGLLKREIRGKRTYKVEITGPGKMVVKNIWEHMTGHEALEEFLRSIGGRFQGTSPTKTTAQIGEQMGIPATRVADAIRSLEDAGKVDVERSNGDQSYYVAVEYVGDGHVNGGKVKAEAETKVESEEIEWDDEIDNDPHSLLRQLNNTIDALQRQRDEALKKAQTPSEELDTYKTQMELITEVLDRANSGKLSPIQALAEIQSVYE